MEQIESVQSGSDRTTRQGERRKLNHLSPVYFNFFKGVQNMEGSMLGRRSSEDPAALLECVDEALRAQEEIKQELLSQLAALEQEDRPQQPTVKTLQFYSTTLKHSLSAKTALSSQIANYTSSVIPDLENQLARIGARSRGLNQQIQSLETSRNPNWLNDARCTDKAEGLVDTLLAELRKELGELNGTDQELKSNIEKAKRDLKGLRDQSRAQQTDAVRATFLSEIEDENRTNNCRMGRKRASTVGGAPFKGVRTRGMSMRVIRPPTQTSPGDAA
jgi:hypothetical protein